MRDNGEGGFAQVNETTLVWKNLHHCMVYSAIKYTQFWKIMKWPYY